MKFVADCMLGRLAKWLKIMGFDVLFYPRAEDAFLLEIARKENRVLLTRDTGLIEKDKKLRNRLFVVSENWEAQIAQVLDEYGLWEDIRPNSRCLACNQDLKPLEKSRARNLVPPHILDNAESFSLCPDCGRVFWPGSHLGDMEEKIRVILKRRKEGGLK